MTPIRGSAADSYYLTSTDMMKHLPRLTRFFTTTQMTTLQNIIGKLHFNYKIQNLDRLLISELSKLEETKKI